MDILIDSAIFLYLTTDWRLLDGTVIELLFDKFNRVHISAASVNELMLLFEDKVVQSSVWLKAEDIFESITDYHIKIVPVDKKVLQTLLAVLDDSEGRELRRSTDRIVAATAAAYKMMLISDKNKFCEYDVNTRYDKIYYFHHNQQLVQMIKHEEECLKELSDCLDRLRVAGKRPAPFLYSSLERHSELLKQYKKMAEQRKERFNLIEKEP